MAWHGALALSYRLQAERTVVHDRHDGPLRILRSLYPEGGICHSVLVHPPGGLVGGDTLRIDADLAEGSHAVLTTPGATRFYRSLGAAATQALSVRMAAGSRCEWLPLETLAFSGCIAENRMTFALDAGAEMIGWDVTALGLPASAQPFVRGSFAHRIEMPGRWLERGVVRADDVRLLDSPLGWAGHRVLATLWFGAGSALVESRRDDLLDAARAEMAGDALAASAGATSPQPGVVVVRALADRVEPAMQLLTRIFRREDPEERRPGHHQERPVRDQQDRPRALRRRQPRGDARRHAAHARQQALRDDQPEDARRPRRGRRLHRDPSLLRPEAAPAQNA